MAQEPSAGEWESARVPPEPRQEPSGWATGFILFAGVMMIMSGMFQGFQGLVAILRDNFYVAVPDYLINVDVTAWGWVHLIGGIIVLLAGFAVFRGALWARIVGITVALLSAVANFFFIPYFPIWSIVIIAVDVFVIWALAAHGRDMAYW
jgi:hypothetical protein